MAEKETFLNQAGNLRRQAENKAANMPENRKILSPEETRQMLHELHVNQIELEMQNEELKRTQLELKTSRDRYVNFYDLSPAGYFTLSEQGLILEANLTAACLLGVTKGSLVRQPLTRFILPEDQDIYYLHRQQLFEKGEPQSCELRMVNKDDVPLWARFESNAELDVDGNPVILIVMRDITERKLAETQIQDAREYAENIVETVREPLLVLNPDLKILTANHSFFDTFKVRPEETIGKFIYDLGNRQWDIPKLRILFEEILPHDTVFNGYEVEHDFLNIGRKTMLLNARQIFRKNIGSHIILLAMEDISDRKRAEAEKAELESQNRQLQKAESLGRMAGAIAHHFNNQLQVVTGNLELAVMSQSIESDVVRNLNEAMEASSRAAEMSSMMLTYLGQTHGKHEQLDLSRTCHFGLSMLRTIIPNTIIVEPDLPSPGPIIRANTNQMHQILTNLVTNAWEAFGENKGAIGLTIKTVSHAEIPISKRFPIDWQPQGISYACLEVSDTGCGIAETDIEKIFDPFFSTKFTGRGLGLPVVLGIIGAHGGGITVESKLGRNSIFRVFLPVSTEEVSIPPEITVEAPEIEMGGTVLVVEDEAQVRDIVKMMLMSLGFTVLEAGDGVEALEIFQQHQDEIRCVLSDLTMPRMDGWETLAALRQIAPIIPVILSSGYDEAQVMAGEHPERPNAFLGKPYQLRELRDAIYSVIYASDWHS